jgi:hypothetical protein
VGGTLRNWQAIYVLSMGLIHLNMTALFFANLQKKKYEAVAQDNGNWIEKAKARGEDLTEYKQKMGEAVRESIMSNPMTESVEQK